MLVPVGWRRGGSGLTAWPAAYYRASQRAGRSPAAAEFCNPSSESRTANDFSAPFLCCGSQRLPQALPYYYYLR